MYSLIFIFRNKIIVSHIWDSFQISCVFLIFFMSVLMIDVFWSPVEKLSRSHDKIFVTHNSKFLEKGYKNRQLFFCKLNLCSVMPASLSVNPLPTSHTVENSPGICLHSWSRDKTILYLISHCFTKINIAWIPL